MKFELLCGDVIERLRTLPDKSINTCVTSPPYYGLRDYGTGTWVGGDPNCPHYQTNKIKEETGKTLIPKSHGGATTAGAIFKTRCPLCGAIRVDNQIGLEETPEEYVQKLVEVFREVKRAMRDDGVLWVNIGDSYNSARTGSVKSKKQLTNNGSVDNMHTKKMVSTCKPKDLIGIPWMLAFALREDGWYLRQDIIWTKNNPMPESVKDRCTRSHEYIFMLTKNKRYWFDHEAMQEPAVNPKRRDDVKKNSYNGTRNFTNNMMNGSFSYHNGKRNKRDVWTVNVCSTVKEAHFAVFPKELIEPCILAGCPEGGWVLDPFNGSGTTGIVAVQNNRNYVGIELNPEYIEITKRRIEKEIGNEKHEVSVR